MTARALFWAAVAVYEAAAVVYIIRAAIAAKRRRAKRLNVFRWA